MDFVSGLDDIQPFDTVQIDGSCSTPAQGSSNLITSYAWNIDSKPVGSDAEFRNGLPADRAELPVNFAGHYCLSLDVTDTEGIRSCVPATQCFDVLPREDLTVQLVWDTNFADLDLHIVGDGGTPFTHESDAYFSNRHPTPADCAQGAAVCSWVDDAEQNPNLDHDDAEGYGPESTSIVHPAPGSHWRAFVHYWNKQTDQDPRTTATVRVFQYGQQIMEVSFVFEDDQQLWQALDIVWPQEQGAPATISQIGVVEPFLRPF